MLSLQEGKSFEKHVNIEGPRQESAALDPPRRRLWSGNPANPVAVGLGLRVKTCVETRRCSGRPQDSDVLREFRVESLEKPPGGDRSRQVHMSNLAGGVDAGIRPTGAEDSDLPIVENPMQLSFDFALDAGRIFLELPPMESASQV